MIMFPVSVWIDHVPQYVHKREIVWSVSLADARRDFEAMYPGHAIFVRWV